MAKPLALQGIGFQVGAALGVAAAGAILAAASGGRFASVPLLADMAGWRVAFILIGLPGIIAMALIPLLHDPKEHQAKAVVAATKQDEFLPFLKANKALVGLALMAAGFSAMGLGAVTAWVPEYLQRVQGIPPMQTGAALGSLLLLAAFAGQGSYGVIVDWLGKRGVLDATVKAGLWPVALSVPTAWMAFTAQDSSAFFAWLTALLICIAPCNAISNTIMQQIAPQALRSRLSALSIFVVSVIGFTLGPALVGWLSQYVFGEERLGDALQIVITGAMALTLVMLVALRSRLRVYLSARVE
jgi:MFS family permease